MVSELYIMATNKERIENLAVGLGGLQANLSRMVLGVNDKLHQLENAISKISEVLSTRQEPTSSNVTTDNLLMAVLVKTQKGDDQCFL